MLDIAETGGAFGMPIIVTKAGAKAIKLARAPVTAERDLQAYIVENPECLPIEEIGSHLKLAVVAREVPTGAGPIDALGVDQEGNAYLIETKLYKNPDKRQVIAQMLDYGAALWAEFGQGGDFRALVEQAAQKTLATSMASHLEAHLETDPERIEELLAILAENIGAGRFRFIVLMDRIDDRLKDLIAFVNAKSQFSVYGVELEFYRHGDETIVIPRLHGAEVRKTSAAGGPRRSWDEEAFFEQAAQLPPAALQAVKDLYAFSQTRATSVPWGTGAKAGSFNPKFDGVSDKSIFTVSTNGKLQLNFGWLTKGGGPGKRFVQGFGTALRDAGFPLPRDFEERYVTLSSEEWVSRLDTFKKLLVKAVEDVRRAE